MEGFNELEINGELFYHRPMKLTDAMKLAHRLLKYASPVLAGSLDTEFDMGLITDFFESLNEEDFVKTIKDILKMASVLHSNKQVVDIDKLDVNSFVTIVELTYKIGEMNLKPFLQELVKKIPKNLSM